MIDLLTADHDVGLVGDPDAAEAGAGAGGASTGGPAWRGSGTGTWLEPVPPAVVPQQQDAGAGGWSRLSRPFVWVLAGLWLAASGLAHRTGRALEGYERLADRVSRAGASALRAVGRVLARMLGPVARLSVRVDRPLVRFVRHLWDAAGLRLLLWLVRPAGRLVRVLAAQLRRLMPAALRATARLLRAVEPVAAWLAARVGDIEDAAARGRSWLSRRAEPVRRAVRRLRGRSQD